MDRIREFLFTKYKAQPVVDAETLMKQKILQWKQKVAQNQQDTTDNNKQKEDRPSNVNHRVPANKISLSKHQRVYSGNRGKVSNSVPASIKEESYDSNTFSRALKKSNNKKHDNKKDSSESDDSDKEDEDDAESAHNTTLRSRSAFRESDTQSESSKKTNLKDNKGKKKTNSDEDEDDNEESETKSELNETRESLNSSMNSSFKVYKIGVNKEKPKDKSIKETPKNVYNDNSSTKFGKKSEKDSFKTMIRDAFRTQNNENMIENKKVKNVNVNNTIKKTETKIAIGPENAIAL